jgi:DNA-binding NarL/FixJ family response regulator
MELTNRRFTQDAKPAEAIPTFVVTSDALVSDWFVRGGHTLGLRVSGRASSIAEAVELIPTTVAAVLVIDLELPDGSGIDLVERLRQTGVTTPILVMSAQAVVGLNEGALAAGANGTALRSGRADELGWAISSVARRRTIWDERNPEVSVVSPRERQVLMMIASGEVTEGIAKKMKLSSETIKTHVQNVLVKYDAHTRAEAVAIAVRAGVV